MDSFVGAPWLATQTLDILCYSPPTNSSAKTVIVDENKWVKIILFSFRYIISLFQYILKQIFTSVLMASGKYPLLATSTLVNSYQLSVRTVCHLSSFNSWSRAYLSMGYMPKLSMSLPCTLSLTFTSSLTHSHSQTKAASLWFQMKWLALIWCFTFNTSRSHAQLPAVESSITSYITW